MAKKLETRWAEVIMITIIIVVLMSSCGSVGYCIQSESLNPLKKQYLSNK